MNTPTFSEFEAATRQLGFDEVIERRWDAAREVETHTHPFAVQAIVTEGEMWLSIGDATRHLRAGDRFELEREQPHAERYGAGGGTYWAARKHRATAG